MESINNLGELLIVISEEVTHLNDAFIELDSLINEEAEYLQRQERVCKINELKSRLVSEINRIKGEENISEHGFNASKRFNSIAGFALGGIVGAITKQNPLLSGYRSFSTELGKKEDFGNVMVAAKKSGKLEDIEAVSISSFVREYKTTESNIISILRDNVIGINNS